MMEYINKLRMIKILTKKSPAFMKHNKPLFFKLLEYL